MVKYWKYTRFIVIPAICLIVCGILYKAIDYFSMGVFADWFDNLFAYERGYEAADGSYTLIRSYNWGLIKSYFSQVLMFVVVIVTLVCIWVSDYFKQKYRRQAAHDISEYMHQYILENAQMPVGAAVEYSEVFSRIVEVRSAMQMREQMLKTEAQRKNDLITYLAHDLKTPLTSVIGYLSFLREEPNLVEDIRARYTEIAYKKSIRLEALIEELFEITRFNISQIELQKENVNLSVMTEQIAHEFLPLLIEKNLHFSMDIASEVECLCDVDKMERIIDNLIRNAISYSYPDSEIGIILRKTDCEIQITFQNSGKNISKEKLDRIFEQFFRLDSSRSSKTGGSGLGLAIAKQLVEAHGGTIQAESENENIRFTIALPY